MNTFIEQLSTILINGGIVLGIYLALLLNNKRAKKSRANLFLSMLLVAMSFSIAHILYAARLIHHISLEVYSLGDPTFLLIAPLLWLYVTALIGQRERKLFQVLVHFLPFGLVVLFSLTFNAIRSEGFSEWIHTYHYLARIFFWVLVVLQFSWYQFSLHRQVNRHGELIRQEVSNTEGFNISWVRFFMIVFLCIDLFFLFKLFAAIHMDTPHVNMEVTALLFALSIFTLGYQGMLQREIFFPSETAGGSRAPSQEPLPADPALTRRILAYMDEKRPYLDPDLTLSSLAKDLEISRGQLSHLINNGIGNNFYDFVNKYRVEEVKKMILDPGKQHYSLLGVALEAGFKSKSTFNLIFKRFTGLTPTEYRKNISSQ